MHTACASVERKRYASTNARGFVEVVNMQWSFEQGYFYDTYENLKAKWATAPEL